MFGNLHAGWSLDQREEHAATLMVEDGTVEKRLKRGFSMWLTLEVARPTTMKERPHMRHLWMADEAEAILPTLHDFAEEGSDFLSVAAARLLPALGERLLPDKVLYGDRRAFALVADKPGFTYPVLTSPAAQLTVGSGGWEDLPFAAVHDAVALPSLSAEYSKLLSGCSRWLWAALGEDDALRRFQFAFFGLEVLANQAAKKMKGNVIADLSAELGLPVEQLAWPTVREADMPWRNLVFHFAIVAIGLSRATATVDVESFRALAKVRNELAHGAWTGAGGGGLPAWEAIDLLRRYVSLLAAVANATYAGGPDRA